MLPEDEGVSGILKPIIGPWYESLQNPQKAQEEVLAGLVEGYKATDYGVSHRASEVKSIADYQRNFPIISYRDLNPYLGQVSDGNFKAFLPEPPECWVMTRGSTGKSKVLPATPTHLKQIFTCGARALINFALKKQNFDVFAGSILNLNFPSSVHTLNCNGKEMTYGYSSGTYARLNPMFERVSLLPKQEEIDALGSELTRKDWQRRFELVYQQAKGQDVTATMGVTPVILAFARYMKRVHGKRPQDLWSLKALFCTSVSKIQFKYGPMMQRHYGQAPIVEMYTATEGVFAQQLDDNPYVTPNFDSYLFEVATGRGVKMLHDLKRGEWGRLIVSSCMLPRYDMGDLVEAAGKNYYRIIGRRSPLTLLEHSFYRAFLGWLV